MTNPERHFMKRPFATLMVCGALLLPLAATAQQYSNNWYKVAGGGGTSTNGQYAIRGTIGQPDAGGPMTSGLYSVTGGFWSIYALQTLGLPNLVITVTGPNSVQVSWPNTGSYTLQTNSNVGKPGWLGYGGTITTVTGTNSVTFTPPKGNLFFRLSSP
jgi:hypothetical protein